MKIIPVVTAFLIFTACSVTAGEEPLNYNIINLEADRSEQVANDVMVAVLQASAQKNSAAEAGSTVNEIMTWADSVIADSPSVEHRTLNYQTHPVYQNRVISGWTVKQQLRLQSSDFDTLTSLIGTLQQRLQVASMHFEVSAEQRKKEVDRLIVTALDAFRSKADLITKTLKAQDFRIVTLTIIDDKSHIPYRRGVQMEAMAVQAAAPVVEAGDSKVQVTVQGKIQIVF